MIIGNNYGHGGDIYKNKISYDFSANVNPYGTPEAVKEAIRRSAEEVSVYPDPYCTKLRKMLSDTLKVSEDFIVCGNGAAELIFQFVQVLKPKKTLLPVPSFSEYESAIKTVGKDTEVILYGLKKENGLAITEDILGDITKDISLLMLCNPNNPSGLCIDNDLLLSILEKCRENDVWLFMDECFMDLIDKERSISLIPLLKEGDKVFILKAFTKLYGMAGVRLGYGICKNTQMLSDMCSCVQPWNVSAPAQAAGCAALSCAEWVKETKKKIFKEKEYLCEELSKLGLKVQKGHANFLMIYDAPGLYEKLLERGILIRDCSNYHGLEKGDCRIAVRRHEENEVLIKTLSEIL